MDLLGRNQRHRVPPGLHRLKDAEGDDAEKDDNVPINRDGKGRPRFLHPAQVDDRHHQHQNERHRHQVGLEMREGRHQRPHTRRRTNGDDQDVVQQERTARDEARLAAQVLGGHGVAAAPVGVGDHRLQVAQHHDGHHRDNHPGDGHDHAEADHADPHQDEEGGFRTVSGAGKGVDPEERKTGRRADFLFLVFGVAESSAEKDVAQRHDQRKSILRPPDRPKA